MSAPVQAGDVLAGKYRVEKVLGEGGMGIVVAATDTQLERRVAIKFLLPDYAEHREASQRFLREARAAVKIQSEHVARVIDVGTMESGAPYMVMEYLEGSDLSGVLDDGKTLPVEEAVGHVLEAADAIAEAHSVGIVHRDLKPANLFLARQPDGSSRIKVLDFGISKAMMTTTGMDPSLTRTSSMMGSPLYMSPEQMRSAKHVDPRTDVWALGAILYESLAGAPPFYAESIPELSAKVLLEEPPSIRSKRPDVPQELENVVKRALAKNPDDRFPTVADFAIALLPYAPRCRANVERASRVLKVGTGSQPQTSSPVGASSAYAQTAVAWSESGGPAKGSRGGLWIGVGVLALALVGGAVFLLGRSSPPATPVAESAVPAVAPTHPEPEPAKAEPEPAVAPTVAAPAPAAASASAAPITPAAAPHPAFRPRPKSTKTDTSTADPTGFGSRK